MFARFFIDRPIFASVLSILVTLGGVVGLLQLPVALYPEIAPPTIEVTTVYPGAHARTLADTVAAPIEEQVNGVENMMYITSTCTNDGMYTLTVTFKPGTNLNIAQVLVQNRVNVASAKLPSEVRRRGVLVKKKSTGVLLMINLVSPDGSRTDSYLSNYATIHIRDKLARLDGIGDIVFLGQRDYSMRIWLNPEKLAERQLRPEDITRAIEQQNAQVAAGQIGQPPVPRGQAMQLIINTPGRLLEPAQFENIIIRTDELGRPIRLRDVTDKPDPKLSPGTELGALSYDQICTMDGKPSVALSVYQLPGSNAIQVAERVRAKMAELKTGFSPGVDYEIVYDTTPFIQESVNEVFHTLRDAVLLVAIVMLVFLQSWRSTIIPLAAVPVALVGTFGAMALLGFSLNTLTLFGLVLAVGIVVDDAIVVVEAVEHHLSRGLNARDATVAAMNDVAGPVVAVGLVLAAVFVPCIFITGIIGQFFQQFAVTIAISTLLSAFNSLTLSPALCALLLRPHDMSRPRRDPLPWLFIVMGFAAAGHYTSVHAIEPETDWPVNPWLIRGTCILIGLLLGILLSRIVNWLLGWGFWSFNRLFQFSTRVYSRVVRLSLFVTPLVLLAYTGILGATWELFQNSPQGFIPAQDKGYFLVNVQLIDASSLGNTQITAAKVDRLARSIPGVTHTVSVAGHSALLGGNSSNFATLHVMLAEFGSRPGSAEIGRRLKELCEKDVPEAMVTVLGAPPVDGLGVSGGYRLMIADRAANDTSGLGLQRVSEMVVLQAERQPQYQSVFGGYRADMPWLELEFNRDKAISLGVEIHDVIRSLQALFGSEYVNDFNRFGRTWQVNIQAHPRYRNTMKDLKHVKVPTRTGEMAPISDFIRERDTIGPVMVVRHNLHSVAPVTVNPAYGISSGEAIQTLERIAEPNLDVGMSTEWTELALLQLQSRHTAVWAIALSVVLVFLVLSAQYESWTLPLVVILVVPVCLLSAVLGVRFARLDINIFTQVGLVVLVGLACKNAILIVEYARKRRSAGVPLVAATIQACELRLRPIVMTSVAFILGVVPLVMAEGAGAEMRYTLGTAVFAGMIGVTLFGVFLTPVFYCAVQWLTETIAGRGRRNQSPHTS